MTNALSIDVEDYFQVSAFEEVSPPETWDRREVRVEANTHRVLAILGEKGVRATFFVLGWVGERYGGLVREIAALGHEVASHGYGHRRVYHQTREEFRDDVRRSKALLEDLSGRPILGYRAPSYSISQLTLWAYDELLEAGYEYDSSVFPIRHDLYGMPDWPRFPFCVEKLDGGNWVPAERGSGQHSAVSGQLEASDQRSAVSGQFEPGCQRSAISGQHRNGLDPALAESRQLTAEGRLTMLEIPITTLRLLGRNVPLAGGGYFRLFPYPVTRWGLRRINDVDGRPFVFYLHPWEIDPKQPRISGAGLKSRFRHYLNLRKTEARFRSLLRDFEFGTIGESLTSNGCARRADENSVPQGFKVTSDG